MSIPYQDSLDSPLLSSWHLNWTGIVLGHYRQPACCLPKCAVDEHTLSIVHTSHRQTRVAVNDNWQRHPCKFGELWLLPAGETTQSQWDGEIEYLQLTVEPTWLGTLAEELTGRQQSRLDLQLQICDPLIHQIALSLHEELAENPDGSHFYADALGHALGVHLLQRYNVRCLPPIDRVLAASIDFKVVVDYIREHLDRQIRLADLARLAHMSPHYFAEQFKQVMGQSPYRYVIHCRINQAQRLLAKSKLPIAEIAYRVGFRNQSHFTRVFRQWTGVTPKVYRDSI